MESESPDVPGAAVDPGGCGVLVVVMAVVAMAVAVGLQVTAVAPSLSPRPRVVSRISLLPFPLVSRQILPPALACLLAKSFRCNLGRSPARLRLSR